jgi:WD40 repeat protein
VWHATADTGKVLRQHKNAVHAVTWSKDGKQLVSGDEDHAVLIWTPENDKAPQSITAGAPVRALALSANGKHLAVGTSTGYVEVYSPVGGKSIQTFERAGSPPQVTSLAWSPDNITLLSGRGNHSAQVWKVGAVNAVADYPGMAPINHVAFTPLGNSAVLSESDRSVRVFDLANGQLRSSVIVDGKQLAVISAAGHYRVHDEATYELVYVVQTAKGQETLSPKEFAAKYKFKNNPAAVMTMDK